MQDDVLIASIPYLHPFTKEYRNEGHDQFEATPTSSRIRVVILLIQHEGNELPEIHEVGFETSNRFPHILLVVLWHPQVVDPNELIAPQ